MRAPDLGSIARVGPLLLALGACGDEPELPRAQLDELCGVDGPVRLLELRPDQTQNWPPFRIGERVFAEVGRSELEGPATHPFFGIFDQELWMTGTCGEAPTRLDEQFFRVFEVERWPGLALACDHSENILSLAPTGPLAPHEVFHGAGCNPVWSTRGAISIVGDGVPRQLLLHPYPDDPRTDTAAPIVLLDAVDPRDPAFDIVVAGDDLFTLTPTRELVRVDLRDGAVTVVQPAVERFVVSPSGRYLAWTIALEPTIIDPSPPTFAMLHDRETGSGVFLGDGYVSSLEWAEQGLVPFSAHGEDRIYRLPGLEFVDVPGGHALVRDIRDRLRGPVADDRWIVASLFDASLHYLDTTTGTLDTLYRAPAQVLAQGPGGALVLGVYPCCQGGRADDEGPAWFFPDDGAAPQQLAERSTLFGWRPRPGLFATLIDLDERGRGKLVLVDTATGSEQLVDDHVLPVFLEDDTEPDVIRYSVQDGARSGIWQVRLPP